MAQYHQRMKVCHTRPAYREGRKEKAVKVYTINDESRYLLVQGVPALKLTKELLDQCSLYGAIHEYRLLEDFPDKEDFTQVYWIQYQQLQAARIAKRKLDDKPFYGGVLHVTYAPEYETVEDTRLKLQDRRKAIARRIRLLETQQKDTDSAAGTSGGASSRAPAGDSDSTNVQCLPSSGEKKTIQPDTTSQKQDHSEISQNNTTVEKVENDILPQLPLPPRILPQSEWIDPPQPSSEFPRIPTAHATLPSGFNPYPEGQPVPNTVPKAKLHSKEIGPHHPSGTFHSNFQESATSTSRDCKSDIVVHSDRDIRRLGRKRQSSDIYETGNQKQRPGSELNLGRPQKQRALDRCSFPRIKLTTSTSDQGVSSGRIPQRGTKGIGFVPRQIQAQQPRDGRLEHGETAESSSSVVDLGPNTGDSSLDNTVQDIRNRMRAVSEAGNRASRPVARAPSNEPDEDESQVRQRPLQVSRNTRRKI